MNRSLSHFIALLLIPCLLTDPVWGFSLKREIPSRSFCDQAITGALGWNLQPLSSSGIQSRRQAPIVSIKEGIGGLFLLSGLAWLFPDGLSIGTFLLSVIGYGVLLFNPLPPGPRPPRIVSAVWVSPAEEEKGLDISDGFVTVLFLVTLDVPCSRAAFQALRLQGMVQHRRQRSNGTWTARGSVPSIPLMYVRIADAPAESDQWLVAAQFPISAESKAVEFSVSITTSRQHHPKFIVDKNGQPGRWTFRLQSQIYSNYLFWRISKQKIVSSAPEEIEWVGQGLQDLGDDLSVSDEDFARRMRQAYEITWPNNETLAQFQDRWAFVLGKTDRPMSEPMHRLWTMAFGLSDHPGTLSESALALVFQGAVESAQFPIEKLCSALTHLCFLAFENEEDPLAALAPYRNFFELLEVFLPKTVFKSYQDLWPYLRKKEAAPHLKAAYDRALQDPWLRRSWALRKVPEILGEWLNKKDLIQLIDFRAAVMGIRENSLYIGNAPPALPIIDHLLGAESVTVLSTDISARRKLHDRLQQQREPLNGLHVGVPVSNVAFLSSLLASGSFSHIVMWDLFSYPNFLKEADMPDQVARLLVAALRKGGRISFTNNQIEWKGRSMSTENLLLEAANELKRHLHRVPIASLSMSRFPLLQVFELRDLPTPHAQSLVQAA